MQAGDVWPVSDAAGWQLTGLTPPARAGRLDPGLGFTRSRKVALPFIARDDVGCDRCAVPCLKTSQSHAKAVHDSTGLCIVRVPYSDQLVDGKRVEGESRHAARGLTGKTLAPEVRMKAPADLDRVALETLEIFRRRGISAKVLDAPCTCDAFSLGLDEGPPTAPPHSPAPLHPCDHRCGLLPRLRLTTYVPHHLWKTVHRMQLVEMTLVEGLQAKPLGVQRGGEQSWFRARPNVRAETTAEAGGLTRMADDERRWLRRQGRLP